jgi:hypothetical protein
MAEPQPDQNREQYSDAEATERMNEALRRALNTPPKPLSTVPRRRPQKAKPTGEDHRVRKPADREKSTMSALLPALLRGGVPMAGFDPAFAFGGFLAFPEGGVGLEPVNQEMAGGESRLAMR